MSEYRYSQYRDGPDPLAPPRDIRSALDDLGRSVIDGARPGDALRALQRRGTDGARGLDELRALAAERAARLRSRGRLDGTLEQVRALLDRAVDLERAELDTDGPEPGDGTRLRRAELDSLPADTAAAVRRLADYQWRSPEAEAAFDELRALLRREVLDSRFAGMKQALGGVGPEEAARVRAMLDALNAMLAADARDEHTQAGFDRFMAEYGDLVPDRPADLDALVDALARRAAAAQRLMDSLTPEQRAELADLSAQAFAGSGLEEGLDRLGAALRARRPDLAWSGGEAMDGPDALGLGDATTALAELGELAELEAALGLRGPGASLDDIDEDAVRRALGEPAVDDIARLRALERELRDQGYLRGTRRHPHLTPKALRRLGETALREVLTALPEAASPREGTHGGTATGRSGEPTGATRPWQFGDERPIDAVRTVSNAVARSAQGGPVHLRVEDFEVTEAEHRQAAAVCLLVDVSYSMRINGVWGAAKRTAMALHTLVSTRYPQDAVQVVGFNDVARELPPSDLAELDFERVQGTNLQHALLIAGRHLDRHPDFTPIVLVVTDGEPTAHLERDGSAAFAWPPEPRTTELTLAEVDRMTRRGADITVFLLSDEPRLADFAAEVAGRNGGRVVHPDAAGLGASVVRDFLRRRRARGR